MLKCKSAAVGACDSQLCIRIYLSSHYTLAGSFSFASMVVTNHRRQRAARFVRFNNRAGV